MGDNRPMLSAEETTIVLLSLKVAAASVVVSLPPAALAALVLARARFPGKTLFDALIHLPLVLPPVVIGYFLLLGFGRKGPFGAFFEQVFGLTFAFRWTGAALAAGIMGFPLMVRAIRLAIEAIDPRLESAARTLGAGPWRVLASVTLPLALPGIVMGSLLAFARSLGEFGATITFVSNIPGETQTLPLAIYNFTQTPGGDAAVLKLCAVSVLLSLAALAASEWLNRRSRGVAAGRGLM
jgi:molybdate transport system permease protein